MLSQKELQIKSTEIRKNIIEQVYHAKSGHPGGSLSCADILTALYFNVLNVNPKDPRWQDRDRFVLSKGHCSPALYATLAEAGFIPKEDLIGFRKATSYLQGHPDMNKVPGVDMSTGSLGQGLSVANGMALAAKLDNKGYRVYAVLGDGEVEEGQIWEACMSASFYKLDNLCVFLDYNNLQIDGTLDDVKSPKPFKEKFEAFGFYVIEIDGHNFEQIINAINEAKQIKGKPTIIIAKTIKGKGVSFMENQGAWHGAAPNDEQYNTAIHDLNSYLESIK